MKIMIMKRASTGFPRDHNNEYLPLHKLF